MPSQYIQDAMIAEVVRNCPDRDARIIDVSCGDGAILKRLKALGYTTLTGTLYGDDQVVFNYEDEDYGDLNIVRNVNLLERLPFEDGAFDIVLNTELLEHLENHRHALQELSRIVRPGGWLVLETPNIMRMASRVGFFLSGFHKPRTDLPAFDSPFDEHVALHVYPVYLPVVVFFLYNFGAHLRRIHWNKWRVFSLLLAVVFYPLILLVVLAHLRQEKIMQAKEKRLLARIMLHPAILVCSTLILAFEKEV